MESIIEWISRPWPWYVAGPLIGLTVPALALIGNRSFGISANLRHACAACLPAKIPFFQYEWKKEYWNILFVAGILLGGILTAWLLPSQGPVAVHPALAAELDGYGIQVGTGLLPASIFSWEGLFTLRGLLVMAGGGLLVGFGTRYAGGCTSGHSIMGLANLQWPSLVATISFMTGGLLMTHFLLPAILSL
ncbi:YeeE/YedE family protein [Chitinophaga lutea]